MGLGRRGRGIARNMVGLVGAIAGLAAMAAAGPAAAWSDLGHQVIGDLAYTQLQPAVRAKLDALLATSVDSGEPSCPVATLGAAAAYLNCVDGIARFDTYRRLHYDAIPFCAPIPPKVEYCKNGQCASEALKRALGVLRDPLAPSAAKLLALEEAAHLIGDLHQPLNMIDNKDNRGERIRVTLPGSSERRLNLHDAWDQAFVAVAVGSPSLGAAYLAPIVKAGARNWAQGDIDGWAAETHQVAAEVIYARLPERPACNKTPRDPEILDRAYVSAATPLVREQLAKAGVRLALVLNDVLR